MLRQVLKPHMDVFLSVAAAVLQIEVELPRLRIPRSLIRGTLVLLLLFCCGSLCRCYSCGRCGCYAVVVGLLQQHYRFYTLRAPLPRGSCCRVWRRSCKRMAPQEQLQQQQQVTQRQEQHRTAKTRLRIPLLRVCRRLLLRKQQLNSS